jgi:hypothetical protein
MVDHGHSKCLLSVSTLMFRMGALWKASKIYVAGVFQVLLNSYLGRIVSVNCHALECYEEPVEVSLGILFVLGGLLKHLGKGRIFGLFTN